MLVCRVVLGEFHVALKYDSKRYKGTDPRCPVRRPPLKSQDGFELFDSILGESKQFGGDALNYREFVVYDRWALFVCSNSSLKYLQVSDLPRVHDIL